MTELDSPPQSGITGRVSDSRVIAVESIEKAFPPALSGWRALLQPVAKPTERALSGFLSMWVLVNRWR